MLYTKSGHSKTNRRMTLHPDENNMHDANYWIQTGRDPPRPSPQPRASVTSGVNCTRMKTTCMMQITGYKRPRPSPQPRASVTSLACQQMLYTKSVQSKTSRMDAIAPG